MAIIAAGKCVTIFFKGIKASYRAMLKNNGMENSSCVI
jgi:hypothetical protein